MSESSPNIIEQSFQNSYLKNSKKLDELNVQLKALASQISILRETHDKERRFLEQACYSLEAYIDAALALIPLADQARIRTKLGPIPKVYRVTRPDSQ